MFAGVTVLGLAGLFMIAQAQSPATNTPTVKVGSAVAGIAAAPGPSATAKNQSQQTSIGKDATSVKASAPSAYWTDLVDIDDDGQIEDNQFLYDRSRGVVYTYRDDNFSCADGSPENGNVLMGIYAKGNKMGQPAGSGWYVVGLKAGQCGDKKAETFGCKFDARGTPTVCGTAKIKEKSGDLEVEVAKK